MELDTLVVHAEDKTDCCGRHLAGRAKMQRTDEFGQVDPAGASRLGLRVCHCLLWRCIRDLPCVVIAVPMSLSPCLSCTCCLCDVLRPNPRILPPLFNFVFTISHVCAGV